MNYNPYAAPQAAPPPPPGAIQGTGQPQPWEIGDVLGVAWEAFKANWTVMVFSYFLTLVISYIPMIVPAVLVTTGAVEPNSTEYYGALAPCYFVFWTILMFFYPGLMRIWVGAARGQQPQFGELFSGASRFLPMFGAMTLLMLAVYVGMIFLIVPGVILGLGLMLAPYYVAEANMGVIEALKTSWSATSGHKGKLFLFGLVAWLISILGYVGCCVGIFVAIPTVATAGAVIYLRLSGRGAPPAMYGGPPGYGGAPPGYPPQGGGYGGPPPGGGGYGPPGGGGGYGGPPGGGGGYGGPPGGGGGYGGPPGGGGGYGGPPGGGGGYGGPPGGGGYGPPGGGGGGGTY